MIGLWLLILPFILWFIELVLPFPALVEELAKAVFIIRAVSRRQAAMWSLLFGLSESFLYLFNASLLQSLNSFWWRIGLTVPMHVLTGLILYAFRRYWWLGVILAGAGHYLFNLQIAS